MPAHVITNILIRPKHPNWRTERVAPLKQLKLSAIIGILLLITGISLFGYSFSVIKEHEQTLNTTELTLDQLWNYEGSLNWWRNVYVTLILPLTAVFISIGGIILASQPLLTAMQHKKALKTFSENVKNASTENYNQQKIEQETLQ